MEIKTILVLSGVTIILLVAIGVLARVLAEVIFEAFGHNRRRPW